MSPSVTRRQFLAGAASVGAVGALHKPLVLASRVRARPQKRTAAKSAVSPRTLVLVTLYGGNDGLNTVAPLDDSLYQSQRGNIAIPASQLLSLGGGFGLNPAMPTVKSMWDAGQVAIVRGVGYPKPNLSHFQSMDIWQSGSTAGDVSSGWLGRWLDRTRHDPFQAFSVGPTVLPAFAGEKRQASALQDSTSGGSQLPSGDKAFLAIYRQLQRTVSPKASLSAAIEDAGTDMMKVSGTVSKAMSRVAPPTFPSGSNPGDIGNQLSIVSQLIRSGLPTTAYAVNQGNYDTHAGELSTQSENLRQLDTALSGFFASIKGTAHAAGTVVMVYTEFGRRVGSNASGGTDHGAANNVYVLGPPVHGGFYGEPPSLSKLDDNGNLVFNVDYRSVYATLLEGVAQFDPKPIVGKGYKSLGFL